MSETATHANEENRVKRPVNKVAAALILLLWLGVVAAMWWAYIY